MTSRPSLVQYGRSNVSSGWVPASFDWMAARAISRYSSAMKSKIGRLSISSREYPSSSHSVRLIVMIRPSVSISW